MRRYITRWARQVIFRLFIVAALLGAVVYFGGLAYVKPAVEEIPRLVHAQTTNYVRYDEISPLFFKALLATEDRRFYDEGGIDWIGIARSVVVDIQARSFVQGGSTITQQLVRDVLLTERKTFLRKLEEVLIATQTARMFSKHQVLEFYANEVYYGVNVRGIADASEYYFHQKPSRLTLPQAALLAGIVQSPSLLDPVMHPDHAKSRRKIVLDNLVQTGQISPDQAAQANQLPLLNR